MSGGRTGIVDIIRLFSPSGSSPTSSVPKPVPAYESAQDSRDPLQREFPDYRLQGFVFAAGPFVSPRAAALPDSNRPTEVHPRVRARRWTPASTGLSAHQRIGRYQNHLPQTPRFPHRALVPHAAGVFACARCVAHPRHLRDHGSASPPLHSILVVVRWQIEQPG